MKEEMLLLNLIRKTINQQEIVEFDEDFDDSVLIKLIKRQKLILMLYPVIEQQRGQKWKHVTEALTEEYNQMIHQALLLQIDVEQFLQVLEMETEECLPLKGWIMREYYPDIMLRNMHDFDILMKNFNREKYKKLMASLGYDLYEMVDGQHDVYYKKPYTVIELHMTLSSYAMKNENYHIDRWLDQIWERCKLQNNNTSIYSMSKEDFYIYHLIHMYKHMTEGGCGIRPVIDIYVYLQKEEKSLDWIYIDQVMAELKMGGFEKCMRILSKECFSPEENHRLSKDSKKLLRFLLESDLYGSQNVLVAERIVMAKGNSELAKILNMVNRSIFLPLNEMTVKFSILKKLPFLLPICWILNIFKMASEGKMRAFLKGISKETRQQTEEIYRIMGMK